MSNKTVLDSYQTDPQPFVRTLKDNDMDTNSMPMVTLDEKSDINPIHVVSHVMSWIFDGCSSL